VKFFYWLLHIIECPEKDLDYFKNNGAICKKCGRSHIIWNKY